MHCRLLRAATTLNPTVGHLWLATISLTEGRTSIMHEGARRRQVVTANPETSDVGGFVAAAQQAINQKVKLPEGLYLEFTGAAEGEAAAQAARALGYRVRVDAHDDDAYRQDTLIDDAIASHAVAIVIDNAGTDASTSAIRRATRAGVPCFLIDREITGKGVAKAQILADNDQGARLVQLGRVDKPGRQQCWADRGADQQPAEQSERAVGRQHQVADDREAADHNHELCQPTPLEADREVATGQQMDERQHHDVGAAQRDSGARQPERPDERDQQDDVGDQPD